MYNIYYVIYVITSSIPNKDLTHGRVFAFLGRQNPLKPLYLASIQLRNPRFEFNKFSNVFSSRTRQYVWRISVGRIARTNVFEVVFRMRGSFCYNTTTTV